MASSTPSDSSSGLPTPRGTSGISVQVEMNDTVTHSKSPEAENATVEVKPADGGDTNDETIPTYSLVATNSADEVKPISATTSIAVTVKYDGTNLEPFSHPDDIVTFLIGPEKKPFFVHKEFSCKHSEVLRAAFCGPYIEGTTGTYTLENVIVEVFRLFVQFLYKDRIVLKSHNRNVNEDTSHKGDDDHLTICSEQDRKLIAVWTLADKLLVPRCQNHVMACLKRGFFACGQMSSGRCRSIYRKTLPKCPLREFAVWTYAWTWQSDDKSEEDDQDDDLPKEMLLDMVLVLRNAAMKSNLRKDMRGELQKMLFDVPVEPVKLEKSVRLPDGTIKQY